MNCVRCSSVQLQRNQNETLNYREPGTMTTLDWGFLAANPSAILAAPVFNGLICGSKTVVPSSHKVNENSFMITRSLTWKDGYTVSLSKRFKQLIKHSCIVLLLARVVRSSILKNHSNQTPAKLNKPLHRNAADSTHNRPQNWHSK